MEIGMMVTGRVIRGRVTELCGMPMEISMKGSGKLIIRSE